jgi:hypothetical protein
MPALKPVSFLSFSLHLTAAQLERGLLIISILLASGFSEEPVCSAGAAAYLIFKDFY